MSTSVFLEKSQTTCSFLLCRDAWISDQHKVFLHAQCGTPEEGRTSDVSWCIGQDLRRDSRGGTIHSHGGSGRYMSDIETM
jgi:hypothetical protein